MKCVADVEGPWVDPGARSGLIERCRDNWSVPVDKLTNQLVATFLRQGLALQLMIPEAQRRLRDGVVDDSELYDGEMCEALKQRLGA